MGKKVDSLRFRVLSKGHEKCISAHKDFHVFFLYEKMRQIPHKNLVVYKFFIIFVKWLPEPSWNRYLLTKNLFNMKTLKQI